MAADSALAPIADPATLPRTAAARPPLPARLWRGTWPKLVAVGLVLACWQGAVWIGWKPVWVLPGPDAVLGQLFDLVADPTFWHAVATTLRRALTGFGLAVGIGTALGVAVASSRVLRAGVGSLITGLQTMPSITWFPLAILLFGLSEQAIAFVVVLGAAPSIANGILSGIDHVPPAFTRLATVLGAHGAARYRYIVLPAALPSYVHGLSQGWAFAWRSLMAGELLVIIQARPSLGSRLAFAQEFGKSAQLLAYMVVILCLGMVADAVLSGLSRRIRARRGLGID